MEENKPQSKKQSEPQLFEEELLSNSGEESSVKCNSNHASGSGRPSSRSPHSNHASGSGRRCQSSANPE